MDNVVKLKNLMVSACTAVQEGHKDIAMNLLEIASEVMENVEPEVIETQFITKSELQAIGEEASEDDDVEDMEPEVASKSFRDVLEGWNFANGTNG